MRWCVTGGLGFIGSRLVRRLEAAGETVRVIDRRRPGGGDVGIYYGFHWTEVQKADIIIHLAAISGIADCEKNSIDAFATNVVGPHNVLEHAPGRARIVMASSGAVVAGQEPPVPVGVLPAPLNVYGRQKATLEAMCAGRENVVCLRFSNVYGPGGLEKTSAVHAFVKAALRNEPLVVHGDGSQSRDFVFVEDVVDAILDAAGAGICGVQHVGTETLTSVGNLAELVIASAGGGHIQKAPDVAPGAPRAALSLAGNAQEFWWQPKTTLDEGVKRTVKWFEEVWR